jgi:hypothetical protein
LNEPVIRHVNRDFVALKLGWAVGEALEWLRRQSLREKIIYFYVVDDGGRLLRRRIGMSFFSVPPSAASLPALSRAINASRPIRTSAVFSCTPVNSAARDSFSSSMFSVVLTYVSIYEICVFVN